MQIRKDKAEKKLLDSTRDSELVREKLQRKLDDALAMLKRKEKEFDETLNHFQVSEMSSDQAVASLRPGCE